VISPADYQPDFYRVECKRCGPHLESRTLAHSLPEDASFSEVERAAVSFVLRNMSRDAGPPRLETYSFERIRKEAKLPRPAEQADRMVLHVGGQVPGPGWQYKVDFDNDCAVIGARDGGGALFIVAALLKDGLIEEAHAGYLTDGIMLSFAGWKRFEELQRGHADSRRAFMAMAFGNAELNSLFESHLKPAAAQAGFDLYRLDEDPRAGLIDDHLRVAIRTARFLVADLTDKNPGAYWEAGFAEGLGKPVIYMCRRSVFEEERTHFDTNHARTVLWDPADSERAATDLKDTIRATLPAEAKMEDGA
jgi:hypothetical protein